MRKVALFAAICGFSLCTNAQLSFTLSSSPAVGNTSQYLASADFNGDGKMDLVTVSAAGSSFYVLTNDGYGGFSLSATLPAYSDNNTALGVDINGDGRPDLLTAGYGSDTIEILTNDGHGGFPLLSLASSGMYPIGIAVADLNGDGKMELLSANSAQQDSTVSVLTNNGSGGFFTSGKYPVGLSPWSVFPIDINGDGKMDLVTANYGDSTVSVLTNNGSGAFAASGTYSVGVNPRQAVAVDVNADGHPDILTANYSDNSITILTNDGSGGFVMATNYAVGNNPDFIAAADVNGDGAIDIVVANYGDSTLSILTNNGVGFFGLAGIFPVGSHPRAVVAVDVNGDDKVDLCTAGESASFVTVLTNGTPFPPKLPTIITQPLGQTNLTGNTAAFTVVATGQGNLHYQWQFDGTNLLAATNSALTLTNLAYSQSGTYAVIVSNYFGSITSTPAILDVRFIIVEVNGQIATGTASALAPATITLFGGYPGGYLFYTLDGSAPSSSSTLYTGQFLLTNSATIRVLGMSADFSQQGEGAPVVVQITPTYTLQTSIVGNGSLSTNPVSSAYPSNSAVTLTATPALNWMFAHWAGDTNGSQNPLSITMNGPYNVQAVFAEIPGIVAFALSSTPAVSNTCNYITAADMNGDGSTDLVSVSSSASSFYVLTNNRSGGFAQAASPPSTSTASTVLAIDVNGDGKIDLVSADYSGNTFTIMTNNGLGGYALMSSPATGSQPIGIAAADLNGDGKLELLAANSAQTDSSVSVLTNDGTGGFSTSGKFPVGSNPWSVFPADVNGDGKLDLVTANYGASTVSVLTNDGHGGFATSANYAVGANPRDAIVVDVNGDGKPDIICANSTANSISILTNNGIGAFVLSAVYATGNNPVFLAAGDVNGDGIVDLTVANYGDSTLLVLTNNGSGGFAAAGTFPVTGKPRAVVAIDVNGDGKLDLCTASDTANFITVLTNGTVYSPIPPHITVQPVGQTNVAGSTVGFTVGAYGDTPLSYQWQFAGTNLNGATNSSLTLTNISFGQTGYYTVIITNAVGSVTSAPAFLDVLFLVVEVNGQIVTGTNSALSPATITLLGGYPNGDIFYTLDGSTPTTSSTLYSAPFTLTNSAIIQTLALSGDFSQTSVPVTVQIIPTYTLQTSIVGSGTVSTNPPGGVYASNTVVTLTATPAVHWAFSHWAGDTNSTQNPLSVTMNGSRNIQAVFVQNAFPLTLTTPGGGSVTANGSGIPASTYYPVGTVVTLAANPNSGWLFLGWQGSVTATNNPLNIVMNGTNVIQGIFGTMIPTNAAGGAIVLSQPNPVPYGTSLTLSAVPNPGNYLYGWTGSFYGSSLIQRMTVTLANPPVGAVFASLPAGQFSLTIIANGSGYVTYSPPGAYFPSNTFMSLTPSPNAGNNFFGWSLGASGRSSPLQFHLTNNTVIQANFGIAPTVSILPPSQTVFAGSNATFTAIELGLPPLTNQWQSSQGPISGATSTNFTILNVQPTNAGNYSVVVSSSVGSVTSLVANLTVIGAPTITNPPVPASVTVGHSASYAVGVYGAPILAYQWWQNGAAVAGATNAALTISNAFAANAGLYTVAITNLYGSVTSTPVGLTVIPLNILLPAKQVNGQFQVTFDTASGVNYSLQYSTNLMDWYPWLNLGGNGQPATLTDPNTSGTPNRFYRIVLTPQ